MSRLASRPYDPTARAILNLIVGEVRPLTTAADYIFVPSHGSFYTENIVVRSGGLLLKKGKDYEFKAFHVNASSASRKPVACILRITNRNLREVVVDYQCVGGEYAEVFTTLKRLIDERGAPEIKGILWDLIADKPTEFNSSAHMHPYWEFDGWEGWHTAINKVLQGVYFRKTQKVQKVYDYLDAKQNAFEQERDNRIRFILAAIEQVQLTNVDPLKLVRVVAGTNPPNPTTQGIWENTTTDNQDRVLGGAGSVANNGRTVPLSKDVVYPQPDNIIMDEDDQPILRDDKEWIYQDNQYPVVPLPNDFVDSDGVMFTEQLWDLHHFRAYHKLGHAGALFANVSADRVSMVEGQTVTFRLASSRYPVGLQVPYRLLGVSPENVNRPLNGFVEIRPDGSAELAVQLMAGSPATYKDTLSIELAIGGGITASVKYTLASNNVKLITTQFSENVNDILKTKVLPYEQFYLMVDRSGFLDTDTKNVQLNFTFDDGVKHPIRLDYNTIVTPGTPVVVELDNAKDWFALQIEPTAAFNSRKLNLNLSYKGSVISHTDADAEDITANVYVVAVNSGLPITEVLDDVAFRFVAETNTTGLLVPRVIENTIGSELTPELTQSSLIENGKAQSPTLTASRKNRKRIDYVTVRFSTPQGKVLGSYRLKIPVNV